MNKIFSFLEYITQNKQKNGLIIVLFAVICIVFSALSIVSNLLTWNLITIFAPIASVSFALMAFYLVFNKLREVKDALATAEVYILKLEAENKDYKMNTDVLLNDPEIKKVIHGRMARIHK